MIKLGQKLCFVHFSKNFVITFSWKSYKTKNNSGIYISSQVLTWQDFNYQVIGPNGLGQSDCT